MTSPIVVALDGPSGSGKSSTARRVASRLGLAYLDTGAMYRAMTWSMLRRDIDTADSEAVAGAARTARIDTGTDPLAPTIAADGVDVAEAIRGTEVTAHVSLVAAVPAVRELLVELQQDIISAADRGIVVEGRDIGSVVAPDAAVKVYLVADPDARALRRSAELGTVDTAATLTALARRDHIDSTRTTSPLVQGEGAVEIDSTHLTLDEVVQIIVNLVEETR